MATDFFGVQLSGKIRQFTKDTKESPARSGREIDLWLGDHKSANVEDLGALAFVSEINVKLKMGENAEISLVLTPPYEEALIFLQSDIIRFGTGRLEVTLGYNTGAGAAPFTTLPFSGFLQKPDVSIGSDITITLHALGVGYQMNVVGGTGDEAFGPNDSYADAVEKVLKKYTEADGGAVGLKINRLYEFIDSGKKDTKRGGPQDPAADPFFRPPDATSVVETQTKTKTKAKTKSKLPDAQVVPGVVIKGPRNDWWFVRETVANFGYDLFMLGNEILICSKTQWIEKNINGENKGRKQFLLRGIVDPTRNMFPILSFSSPTTAVWLQPGIGRQVTNEVDVNKQDDAGVTTTADDKTTPITRGKQGADPAKTATADGTDAAGRTMPGDASDPEVQKKVEAHWTDMNMDAGIQGTFTTLGIPGLIPGESVDVTGFEPYATTKGADKSKKFKPVFNGTYGVVEVNHKIGVGGWETSFLGVMGFFPEHLTNIPDDDKSKASTPAPSKGTLETRSEFFTTRNPTEF